MRAFTDAYAVPGASQSVGITYPRGVGGPAAVLRAEELAAVGARAFIGVGIAGGLAPGLRPGDVVVCDRAVRDEGTSHHYAPADVPARASPSLNRWLAATLTEAKIPFRSGASWTTDAPYRETLAEVRHYRKQGVLSVEMEASALFIFARHRGLRAASVLVVSDLLTDRGWSQHFHRVGERLESVAAALVAGARAS